MIRLKYSWRRPEGVKSGIPKLRALHYKFDCFLENMYIRLEKLPDNGLNADERKEVVTISLTTFPDRIEKSYYAIKSLMLQSYKPDRIILWLAEEQFPDKKLPHKFDALQAAGLEIKYCQDLRSHKKYFYALQEQKKNELVVTYDDDIIYEHDSLQKLVEAHTKYPNAIICNRGHEMMLSEDGVLQEYSTWKIHSSEGVMNPSMRIMPSTGNGCLYPFQSVPAIAFDWQIIKENALTADDIWMRFCSLQKKTQVVKTRETIAILCNVWGSQHEALTNVNDLAGENQRVIDNLLSVFPETFN